MTKRYATMKTCQGGCSLYVYRGGSPNGHPPSVQLYLRPPSQNPIFHNSHTNSVVLHSRKRAAPVTGTIFASQGWPLTRASTVLHSPVRSCGRQDEPAILISRLLRMRRMYLTAFVWTSTKNEWNAKNAI